MKFKINLGQIVLIILLISNLVVVGILGYNSSLESNAIVILQNKLEIFAQYHQETVNKIIDQYNEILVASAQKILGLEKAIETLQKLIDEKKSIDLTKVNQIKEANLLIINATAGFMGSGTHIKLNNKSYILTCAHLLIDKEDKIVAQDDNGYYHFTEVVKVNEDMDLMLLETTTIGKLAYLEISDIFPEQGSEVTVIGNPSGLLNMITDGIISQIEKTYYIITNKIYFGNSGGALIYKGKVVGVISQIATFSNVTLTGVVAQNYGVVVKLEHILTFLSGV